MADVEKLRKQRSYIKGKLIRLEQTVARFQEQATAMIDKEDAEIRLERLEQVINEFQTVQRQIISETDELLATDSVLVQLLQKQMTIMKKYEAIGTAQVQASSEVRPEDNAPLGTLLRTQTELLQRLTDNSEDGVTSGNRVKLPTINLPSFNGKIEEWTKFADAFKKTIHSNRALPNIQKFIYLRSCVSGAAARVIEDIELFDDNYSIA
ncbi:hypothetical protein ALC60_07614 [Trachymyrmex zeteki]|uniref:Uncharacterized protein n=1 Tax=Mycetomoellerius zeteki TaxID=64791 RepID=A0A151WZX1_9HYME|nr:hypothetical protein ALC60_07614 [Trachymyrmex zeteki]